MSAEVVYREGLVRVILSGTLTDEDLATTATRADEIERGTSPVPHRLTDVTGVTDMKIGYPDVKALANHRRAIPFTNDFKSAIVVNTPVQRGMARMFQSLNDNPRITIQIFDDEATALAWLRE